MLPVQVAPEVFRQLADGRLEEIDPFHVASAAVQCDTVRLCNVVVREVRLSVDDDGAVVEDGSVGVNRSPMGKVF